MTDLNPLPRWGVVATVKAPAADVLTFVAHHLDLGGFPTVRALARH